MKANLKDYVSAILVIACSLVLLAAIQYGLTGKGFTHFTRFVEVDIEDATGLRLHSEVRYAGAIIGRITEIRYLSEEEIEKSPNPANLIHITAGLDDSAPELPENLTASPAAETLLGEKFLGLKPNGVAKGKLKEGQVVQGSSGLSIDDLIRQIQPALMNVTEITAQVRNDLPGMTGQLDGVLSDVRSLLEEAESGVEDLTRLVSRFNRDYPGLIVQLDSILEEAVKLVDTTDQTVGNVGQAVNRVDGIVADREEDIQGVMAELRVVLQNLKVLTTYGKILMAQLSEKPSRIIWGRGKKRINPSEEEILKSTEPVRIPSPAK